MLYATYHNAKASKVAQVAIHRAMFFDDQTSLDDAHTSADAYLNKVKGTRAWGNTVDTSSNTVKLSPMSGIKDGYFYPARSASLVSTNPASGTGYDAYTAVQTAVGVVARYFTVQDGTGYYQWNAGQPVFTGRDGRSKDSSEDYFWPSNCMLVVPAGVRANSPMEFYSSKGGLQYSRSSDPFWRTYSGYDAGFNNAALKLGAKAETNATGYLYISSTTSPIQQAAVIGDSFALDHVILVRSLRKTYSYSGLNQFSSTYVPGGSNGVAGYTRPEASFPMRIPAVSGLANTPDTQLKSCMMAFNCNGLGYLVRSSIGQDKDIVPDQSTVSTTVEATLQIQTGAQMFPDKTLIAV